MVAISEDTGLVNKKKNDQRLLVYGYVESF